VLVRSVEEQQARVTAAAVAPRPVRLPIAEAQGLMCAEEVVTEQPIVCFDLRLDRFQHRSGDAGIGADQHRESPVAVDQRPQAGPFCQGRFA
jgi:molybdopterin molybdotransferase